MCIYANIMLIFIYITLYLIILFKHHLTCHNNSFSWEEKSEFKYITLYICSVYSYDEISSQYENILLFKWYYIKKWIFVCLRICFTEWDKTISSMSQFKKYTLKTEMIILILFDYKVIY